MDKLPSESIQMLMHRSFIAYPNPIIFPRYKPNHIIHAKNNQLKIFLFVLWVNENG